MNTAVEKKKNKNLGHKWRRNTTICWRITPGIGTENNCLELVARSISVSWGWRGEFCLGSGRGEQQPQTAVGTQNKLCRQKLAFFCRQEKCSTVFSECKLDKHIYMGFSGGSDCKESAWNARPRFNPWVGTIPWRREWLPPPVFWPGEFWPP